MTTRSEIEQAFRDYQRTLAVEERRAGARARRRPLRKARRRARRKNRVTGSQKYLSLLSAHRAQVAVEPVDGLLHQQILRRPVPALGDDLPLVLRRRAQDPEERKLRGLHRAEEVVAPFDHQRPLPRSPPQL